jgi:hypothetical protein
MADRSNPKKARGVILISGSGTTMENLLLRAQDGSCLLEPAFHLSAASKFQ